MQKKLPTFDLELSYWQQGYTTIGIDEVGRGCLAGPITVGAVCFDPACVERLTGVPINDSKKLSPKQRKELEEIIRKSSLIADTSFVDVDHINEKGIVSALLTAISNVVQKCLLRLSNKQIMLLIDGQSISDIPYTNAIERKCIIKGDSQSISIASASIIAKVERDAYMDIISQKFADYQWHRNKGYGTLEHRNAILTHGLTPHHRTLFVRRIIRS